MYHASFWLAVVAAGVAVLFTTVDEVVAWGHVGHSLMGQVAMQLIRPETRLALKKLLPGADGNIALISSWADEVKNEERYKGTGSLHFADTHDDPPYACSYVAARDCPNGDCITVAIQEFSWAVRNATLAAKVIPTLARRSVDARDDVEGLRSARIEWVDAQGRTRMPNRPPRRQLDPPADRRVEEQTASHDPHPTKPPHHDNPPQEIPLGERFTAVESLKFLVHLVQDIHQPLHVSGRERGGNDVQVVFNRHDANLHGVWDTLMLKKHMHDEFYGSEHAFARDVVMELATTWKGDVLSWVRCPLSMPGINDSPAFVLQGDPGRSEELSYISRDMLSHHGAIKTSRTGDPAPMSVVLCPEFWAQQSDQLNCGTIWQNLEEDLAGAYHETNLPIARKAIAMGAVRLAALLDAVLAGMEV
ncbi:hypothetical protein AMAG_17322 [Allomyces macrogynus ATCC 38327]|uniref:S1/P1 nuclease n=1 Tax=Allomyces macrogynus (strain ATCC 38327) TaxID=578462 RepID=A0A0L0TDX0_ALLM3|nr:hypothetical protein AMAG_17322 [Allomyces macrogynus ATCC 38327]|eukprot:KNE73053.1 hypothetical protein AMAG_17322 [Allomyces macrogynus ATCC 38327]